MNSQKGPSATCALTYRKPQKDASVGNRETIVGSTTVLAL